MRKILFLSAQELQRLRDIIQQNESYTLKKRSQCIIYSHYGLTVTELTETLQVDRRTIYNWLNRWEKARLEGLKDKAGRGIKPKLNLADDTIQQSVLQSLSIHPRNLQQATRYLNELLPQSISSDTLRRYVKKLQEDNQEQNKMSLLEN